MIKKVITIVTIFFIIAGCNKYNYNVEPFNIYTDPTPSEGFYYALPQTLLKIDMIVEKEDKIKGPYAAFASKYLGLKNVIWANSSEYKITDVIINTASQPDPDQYFFVELFNKKGFKEKEKQMFAELTESGLIKSINTETTAIKKADEKYAIKKTTYSPYNKLYKLSAYDNLYEKVDTIIEKVNIDTITIEKEIYKKKLVEKSSEQKAKEAADHIMDLKKAKVQILKGYAEVNYSQKTMQYMINRLDSIENNYLSLFTGITHKRKIKYSFTYLPEPNQKTFNLCKFSAKEGILDKQSQEGEFINISLDYSGNTSIVSQKIKQKNRFFKKANGFFYRIPEIVKVSINREENVITKGDYLISQFGIVTSLPPVQTEIMYYPSTGALKKVNFK